MPDPTQGFTARAAKDGGKRKTERGSSSMNRRLLKHLNYPNAVATLALFIALGGVAVAAGLPRNSVGPQQLRPGAVTTAKLQRAAVKAGKLAPRAVIAGKIGAGAVLPGNIVNGGITTDKLANSAVIARSIRNGSVTTNKLNNAAVTSEKLAQGAVTTPILANGAVTPAKLSNDFGPLISPLRPGQTLRGVFDVGGMAAKAGDEARAAQTFQFPLLGAPTVHVVPKGTTTAECQGLAGGNAQTPQAAPGHLCIYITESANLAATEGVTVENNTRLGFGLLAKAGDEEGKPFYAYGQWAATAP